MGQEFSVNSLSAPLAKNLARARWSLVRMRLDAWDPGTQRERRRMARQHRSDSLQLLRRPMRRPQVARESGTAGKPPILLAREEDLPRIGRLAAPSPSSALDKRRAPPAQIVGEIMSKCPEHGRAGIPAPPYSQRGAPRQPSASGVAESEPQSGKGCAGSGPPRKR